MTVQPMRALACALALSTMAACTTMRHAFTSGGEVDLDAYPRTTLTADESSLLRGMSDANIIGYLMEVDSMEVAAADTVMRISKSDDILDFAKLLRLHHSQDRSQLRDLANRTNITPTIDVTKLRASSVAARIDTVRRVQDATIEPNFLMAQIDLHSRVLSELDILQSVAREPAVRQHLGTVRNVVSDHLAKAHSLAIARGYEKRR